MFIVPLPGDQIQTVGGVSRAVLSFGNYDETPAVYVAGDGADTIKVPLGDIVSVNGTAVRAGAGHVLLSTGHIKRKEQLPQRDDAISAGGERLKVKGMKLGERGKLSAGLLVTGVNDSKETKVVRAADIESIVRADGSAKFSRRAFLNTYKDYLGSAV